MSVLSEEKRIVEACEKVMTAHNRYIMTHSEYVAWDRRNFMPVPVEEVPEYIAYLNAGRDFRESVQNLRDLIISLKRE